MSEPKAPATDEELLNDARATMMMGMAATTPDGRRLHTPEELIEAYGAVDVLDAEGKLVARKTQYVTLHANAAVIALRPTKTG